MGGACAANEENAEAAVVAYGIMKSEETDEDCRREFRNMSQTICPRVGGTPNPPQQCDCGQTNHRGCRTDSECDSRHNQRVCCSYLEQFVSLDLCAGVDKDLLDTWIVGRQYLGECYEANCNGTGALTVSFGTRIYSVALTVLAIALMFPAAH
eukprot:729940-Rhodomonas_salina.1